MKFKNLVKRIAAKCRFRKTSTFVICLFCFYVVFLRGELTAQICDKKSSIFFETDKYEIEGTENGKLERLCKLFAQKTDTFMLEVDAFTDSVASEDYNYELAKNRLNVVVSYLKKNSSSHFEIKERVRGEALPLGSNTTEEGRAKNRRVDIYYWKLRGDKITITGKEGTEMDIQKDFFSPCGVCESKPQMTEVFTNEEAERQGISLVTTENDDLITGGMMDMVFDCPEKNKTADNNNWPCADVVIRIPASNFDEDLEIWKSTRESNTNQMRWSRDEKGQLQYDSINKCYIMIVNYCLGIGGSGGFRSGINLDKPRPNAVIALPELKRKKKDTHVNASRSGKIVGSGKSGKPLFVYLYNGEGNVIFDDAGLDENKIGYVFSGNIDKYEAQCDTAATRTLRQRWCYEIPLEAYTKVIHFQKNYRLKVPLKYKHYSLKLFIPAADTLLPLTKIESSSRKHVFKRPLPETYVVLYKEGADVNNKRAFSYQADLSKVRPKYSKRKRYYKGKIKRKHVK